MTYDIFLSNTNVVKFDYSPDQEDASDAAVVAALDEERFGL